MEGAGATGTLAALMDQILALWLADAAGGPVASTSGAAGPFASLLASISGAVPGGDAPSPGLVAASGAPVSLAADFRAAAAATGLSPALLEAVARQESDFNPTAVSGAGAIGVMQLMPGTAAELHVNPANAQENILGGARYLAGLLREFGSVPLALAAYNAGPGAVDRYGGIPPYAQTEHYVRSIMAMLGQSPSDIARS
jgi:soluble lytic murein transglycosylase-like protein